MIAMDFSNIFDERKDDELLRSLEKAYIFTHKLHDKYENEMNKPICILIKSKTSEVDNQMPNRVNSTIRTL